MPRTRLPTRGQEDKTLGQQPKASRNCHPRRPVFVKTCQHSKQDLKGLVQTELANLPASSNSQSNQKDRLRKLEVGVAEIRQQNIKFETWFSEFGKKVATQGQELGNLSQSVQQQSQAFSRLQSEVEATMSGAVRKLQSDMTAQLKGPFEQLQSLLADKKSRRA